MITISEIQRPIPALPDGPGLLHLGGGREIAEARRNLDEAAEGRFPASPRMSRSAN